MRRNSQPRGQSRRGRSRDGKIISNSSEAPLAQQITWSKQMTSLYATVHSVLYAAHGQKFSARNHAIIGLPKLVVNKTID